MLKLVPEARALSGRHDLPTGHDLFKRFGADYLCAPSNINLHVLTPTKCMKCNGFVHRLGGSCVVCSGDYIVVHRKAAAKQIECDDDNTQPEAVVAE